jgi:hypothetical protein
MTLKVLRSFTSIHKTRLKNVFFRFLKDPFIWQEIEKMIETNFVNISNNSIYDSRKNLSSSLLSSFLFNLYMLEIDFYLEKFIFKYSLKKIFYKGFKSIKKSFSSYKYKLNNFFPLRVEQNLKSLSNLRTLNYFKYNKLNNYIFFYNKFSRVYEKNVYYCRYLDALILGFISSKTFVSFLEAKVVTLLRTNLHFDIKELTIFDFKEKNVIFLGIYINPTRNSKFFSNLRVNRKYFLKTFGKILKSQSLLSNFLNKRFHYNFNSDIYRLFPNRSFCTFSSRKSFCDLIFHSQALYYIRLNNLFLTHYKNEFSCDENLTSFKYLDFSKYNKYVFNFYNSKLQILLQHILKNLSSYLSSSLSPLDLKLYNFLLQFKRNILLLYNECEPLVSFSNQDENKNSKLYIGFSSTGILFRKSMFFSVKKKSLLYNNFFLLKSKISLFESFNFFIPFKILLKKLKSLGFLHPFKNRPISNVHFIFFEDVYIIKSFGFVAYSFLHWFSLCKDFSRLRFLIELIKESCFLTLCRKHNKSKVWAYSVYTFDLIISKNLHSTKSFFPKRDFFYLEKIDVLNSWYFDFDESFFLES